MVPTCTRGSQAWAEVPVSPAECRFALTAALQKIKSVSASTGKGAGAHGNADVYKEVGLAAYRSGPLRPEHV